MKIGRELGTMGLSIATDVAIEVLLSGKEGHPSEIWINLRTAFRNLYGSLDTSIKYTVDGVDLADDFLDELKMIHTVIDMTAGGAVKPIFYYCDYSNVNTLFEFAKVKVPRTEKQKIAESLELQAIELALNTKDLPLDIRTFKTAVKGKDTDAWILTHVPIDLLSRRYFRNLLLLESHTGTLKGPGKWNTKLTNGKTLIRMPFNELTIQVFGDGNNIFNGQPIKIKKLLIELANEKRWGPLTTRAKIKEDLKTMSDRFTADYFTGLVNKRVK
jgi:hypothetical protein